MRRFATAAVLAALLSAPAMAEPATPAGADRIAAALGRYLPGGANVLSVTPQGETYALRLKPDAYAALLPPELGSVSVSALDATLTDLGGGSWGVAYDQPYRLVLDLPGTLSLDMTIDRISYEGLFDESLGRFRQASMTATGIAMAEQVSDPLGTRTDISYRLDRLSYTATGAAGGSGGVDLDMAFVGEALTETATISGPRMAEVSFEVQAASYTMDGAMSGMRNTGLLELIAFLVAHPSIPALAVYEDGLKQQIRALLPVFDRIDADASLGQVSVATPLGEFTADALVVGLSANGVLAEGRGGEWLSVEGLSIPPGLVPAWAEPLLPAGAKIGAEVSGFDAAAWAEVLLDGLTFGAPPPADLGDRLFAAGMPDRVLTITLVPGNLTSADYALTWDGALIVGPGRAPTGKGLVTLTGMDAVLTHLNAGPPEVQQGTVPGLMMLRGLGRAEGADKVTWELESTPSGQLLVNGADLAPMLGR